MKKSKNNRDFLVKKARFAGLFAILKKWISLSTESVSNTSFMILDEWKGLHAQL